MLKNNVQSRNDKLLLYICIAGLLMLFAIETIGQRVLNEYIHTAWILCFSAVLSYEGILYLLSFLIPTCTLLPHFAHVFVVLFAVLVFKKFFIEKCKTFNLSWAFIIAFSLWEMLAYVSYNIATLNKVIGYISVVSVFFWALYEKKHGDYRRHLSLYIFGVFALSIFAFITAAQSFSGNWISAFFMGGLRLGGTANSDFSETDVSLNANTLAYFSIVAVACYLSMRKNTKDCSISKKTFEFVEFTLILIMGMLTVSRSWLLVLAGIIALFVFGKLKDEKNLNKTIPIIFGIILISLVFIKLGFMEAFIVRFQTESVDTAGGRTDLIKHYFSLFFSNLRYMILGTGVTDYTLVMGTVTSMHNGTQQILICLGLPFAALFFTALFIPIYRAQSTGRKTIQLWLPFIAVVLFVQTIQFLNPNTFMLSYIIGLYALRMPTTQK